MIKKSTLFLFLWKKCTDKQLINKPQCAPTRRRKGERLPPAASMSPPCSRTAGAGRSTSSPGLARTPGAAVSTCRPSCTQTAHPRRCSLPPSYDNQSTGLCLQLACLKISCIMLLLFFTYWECIYIIYKHFPFLFGLIWSLDIVKFNLNFLHPPWIRKCLLF